MRRLRTLLLLVPAVVAVLSCGDDGTPVVDGDGDPSALSGTIRVFAAASLTDAFTEIGHAFETLHPGVSVEFSFAGSSSLREQILQGAPADVYASANEANMTRVVEAREIGSSRVFASNRLQIVVPSGNPAGVTGLADFADPELLIGLCAEGVPCGDFGRRALEAAGVIAAPDTNEPDVRALLTKIEAGELDAGIVYVTDVAAAGDGVEGIAVPDEFDVVARYPIGTVASTDNPDVASAFVDFVLGAESGAILQSYGFGPP